MEENRKILHIFVIGFHHKKGCQLEYSYPEVEKLPEEWKNLPSLAMPDGAHNYQNDTVYFHLPNLNNSNRTIFGISCFQQISIEKVKKKTMDMTRGAVQKAVCILSTVPLYGYIQVKMELVTAAFFDEGDFSKVSLLQDAYHHLNDCIVDAGSHTFDGLSARDFMFRFRHSALILFKLVLLEKRVVFFHSPVKPLCDTILTLISLFPGSLEQGLFESCLTISRKKSVSDKSETNSCSKNSSDEVQCNGKSGNHFHLGNEQRNEECNQDGDECNSNSNIGGKNGNSEEKEEDVNLAVESLLVESYLAEGSQSQEKANADYDVMDLTQTDLSKCGLPLSIFTKGNLCLPYLSISYLDLLTDNDVRGFVGGASNVLFKQKRQIADVLVDIESCKIETYCPELRRQLDLTTQDLRFADNLVRCILESKKGSEQFIRDQFTLYLLSFLRSSMLEDGSKEIEHFNVHFVRAWRNTHNFRMWVANENSGIWNLNPGHPAAGTLSVADVRLRFSQVMSTSESGRRINQAVATTGKAVGGAITNAKVVLSHWWTNLTSPETKNNKTLEDV